MTMSTASHPRGAGSTLGVGTKRATPAGGLYLDAHVHCYPSHGIDRMLRALLAFASRRRPGATAALLLLERQGSAAGWNPRCEEDAARSGWRTVIVPGDPLACDLESDAGRVRVYAGRQLVSAERLEVAVIGPAGAAADGQPLATILAAVTGAGGYPLLAWGVGKWLGGRGRLVLDWVRRACPADGGLSDSALRPLCWPLPAAMRLARRRGLPVLAGSDPMPRPADAGIVGRYAAWLPLDEVEPPNTVGLIRALQKPPPGLKTVGRRSGPVTFLLRQTSARQQQRLSH